MIDFEALAKHGICVSGGDIHLGDGWRQQADAYDGCHVWSNGDLTINVSEHTIVTHDTATTPDPAAEAALKMNVEHS